MSTLMSTLMSTRPLTALVALVALALLAAFARLLRLVTLLWQGRCAQPSAPARPVYRPLPPPYVPSWDDDDDDEDRIGYTFDTDHY